MLDSSKFENKSNLNNLEKELERKEKTLALIQKQGYEDWTLSADINLLKKEIEEKKCG